MKAFKLLLAFSILSLGAFFLFYTSDDNDREDRVQRKKARLEHYQRMLKDPATGVIPSNVRLRELAYRERMKERYGTLRTQNDLMHSWSELGPSNVGGRTRALALDRRNSNIVFAAGVSGGIWKSTDDGTTWRSVSPNGSNLSITSIAQDAVNGDTWYASTGEVSNNSASGKNSEVSPFGGAGVYMSTNNGETWDILTYTESSSTQYTAEASANLNIKNSQSTPFEFTTKVYTHSFAGINAVFVCSQNRGIWVSTDHGQTFDKFAYQNLGELGNNLTDDPQYVDVVVDDSDIITVFLGVKSSQSPYGLYRSYDQGETFFNITPEDYLGTVDSRTILAFAPSNNKILYAFNHLGVDDHSLYAFDFTNYDDDSGDLLFSDLSDNLPSYERSIYGEAQGFSTQEGYDMALAIHPSNPDIVILGFVNLVRSIDGFRTSITGDAAFSWIGGDDNPDLLDEGISFEEGFKHHADQHALFFDPNNPDMLWSGHDGGLSKTSDITANRVSWTTKNNDYNVTQYFHISISQGTEKTVIGGTQDNGTPYMDFSAFGGSLLPSLQDVSSGDGSYSYIAEDFYYSSSQEGNVTINNEEDFFEVLRPDFNKLFVHPFAIDPNDEGTIFFPEAFNGGFARNTQLDEALIALDQSVVEDGWEDIEFDESFSISTLRVTDMNPSHRLYIGGTDDNEDSYLLILDNATTATANDIDRVLVGAANGAWLNDIAINPVDGDEILLVYSNYNIDGLYHSTDGGQTFAIVEGNLGEGDDRDDVGETGPSMRGAEIITYQNGDTKYIVATSIGVFSAESLDGSSTLWELEVDQLDNVVVEDLDVRKVDNTIVVGTLGRGAFLGQVEIVSEDLPNLKLESFSITNAAGDSEVLSGETIFGNFTIANTGTVDVSSTFQISLLVDGETDTFDFDIPIPTGQSITQQIDFGTEETEGEFSVTATLDSNGAIAETDETDNAATAVFSVVSAITEKPNLVVSQFTIANQDGSSSLTVGDQTFFSLTITNEGTVPTETGFTISYQIGEELFTSTVAEVIGAGEAIDENVEVDGPTAPGELEVVATLDSEQVIAESNENDNSATVTVTVQDVDTPDPLSVDFNVASTTVISGESISFDPSVTGGVPPYSYSWTFDGGNPSTSTEEQPTILYSMTGNFDVSLVVTDDAGTSTTESKTGFVIVEEEEIETGIIDPAITVLLKVYPNPAVDLYFTIEMDESVSQNQIQSLRLISLNGQSIPLVTSRNEGNWTISTKGIPTGMYILLYQIKDKFGSKKLFIN